MRSFQRSRRIFRPPLLKRLHFAVLNFVKNRRIKMSLRRFSDAHHPMEAVPRAFDDGVAVVIPCFNHGAYLTSAIESVVRQSHRPLQLILVDDCSTDDSYTIMQRFMHQRSDGVSIMALKTPFNSGQANALNMGICATDASVIMVLDADDYLMHDALEVGLVLLHQYESIYLLGAANIPFAGNDSPTGNTPMTIKEMCSDVSSIPVTRYTPVDVLLITGTNDINMTHSGTLFFRSAWQAVDGYYTDRSHRVVVFTDRDFQLRVGSILPIAVCETIPFTYYREGSSVQFGGSGDSAALWSPQSLSSRRQKK